MVLGAVWCPLEKTREIAERVCEIKAKHGMPPTFEAKASRMMAEKCNRPSEGDGGCTLSTYGR